MSHPRGVTLHELLHRFARDAAGACVITRRRPVSPLLSTRQSEAVTHRLLAACGLTALLALLVAVSAGDTGRPTAAAPTFLAAGAICSAFAAYLLFASARG